LAWSAIVLPCLALNYAGQAAIVLDGAPTADNIFYQLCPAPLLVPFIILATIATIIASQSIITGAFSMTRQAIRLGWLPRVRITQTSVQGYGQIYVGSVNWLLMVVTVALALFFGKSDNLAAAYGIAVSLTMLMTTVLLYMAMREVWGWSIAGSGAVAGVFLCVDTGFFVANMSKVADGGYVPLILAALVYGVMWIWHRGSTSVVQSLSARVIPVAEFLASLVSRNVPRVPGTAVFLTRTLSGTPPIMIWHVEHNRALHESLLSLSVTTEPVPWIEESERLVLTELAPKFWHAAARYGFMERPDIPVLLEQALAQGCRIKFDDVIYYVGHMTVFSKEDGTGMPRWEEALFAAMERNAEHLTDFFRLPRDGVVEIGRHIAV
jgi:KUP system potassium uptake protein